MGCLPVPLPNPPSLLSCTCLLHCIPSRRLCSGIHVILAAVACPRLSPPPDLCLLVHARAHASMHEQTHACSGCLLAGGMDMRACSNLCRLRIQGQPDNGGGAGGGGGGGGGGGKALAACIEPRCTTLAAGKGVTAFGLEEAELDAAG
jgi:hypothetical protein